ncbi:MAG: hypothetical protein AAFQ36_14100 [Pseudomonadota bacterium]
MRDYAAEDLDRALLPPTVLSFADVANIIEDDLALPPVRKRDLVSGLRRIADALQRSLGDVPANPKWLQPRLAAIEPAAMGIAQKTWTNAVSNARSAFVIAGIVEGRQQSVRDLTTDWRALWSRVLTSNDSTISKATRRLVFFLSRLGVHPQDVEDDHLDAFHEALARNEISKDPVRAYRAAANGWNLAIDRIEGWPSHRFTLPMRQHKVALPIKTFSQSFQGDLAGLVADLADPDPLSDLSHRKPLRPDTIRQYRKQILCFASRLVTSGVNPKEIRDVQFLLNPQIAKRGLQQMLDESNGEINRAISETAALLRNLGGILRLPETQTQKLADLAKRVRKPQQLCLTDKNRERLRVLQDQRIQNRLFALPDQIFARSAGSTAPYEYGLAREDALAIAILLVAPLRVKNLSELHLEHSLHRPGDVGVFLTVAEQDSKNGRSLEFELPRDVVRLLNLHLKNRSAKLCPPGTPWLFPRRDGLGPVDRNQLSARIRKRLRRELGIHVHTHLFRHFAVMVWLEANPGSYEIAKRLLGHSELSHTINMYSGLEATAAIRAFGELIAQKRNASR